MTASAALSTLEYAGSALGIAMLVVGGGFALWLRKRRFDRTNECGIERFSGFTGSVLSGLFDGILWLASLVLVVAGGLMLALFNFDSWGWIVIGPFMLWFLFGFAFAGRG